MVYNVCCAGHRKFLLSISQLVITSRPHLKLNIMNATLRLFRAIPIIGKKSRVSKSFEKEVAEKTIPHGFLFSKEILKEHSAAEIDQRITQVADVLGLSAEQANSSFHKSWAKVRDADIEQLVLEQIVHYFTTYGFEDLGVYNEDTVYIPTEKLELPDLDIDKIQLTVIHGYTKQELKDKLTALLKTGIALKDQTREDVVKVALLIDFNGKDIESIKNREVKASLYALLDRVPENPVEFLRYLVYRTTGSPLLIKSDEAIETIRGSHRLPQGEGLTATSLFTKYDKQHGLDKLATVFYRFKPLFLAFKSNPRLNNTVNKIRKLAIKHHKPMAKDYLNDVTRLLKTGTGVDEQQLQKELAKANTFRKIRLAYALKYRTVGGVESILYRIRNGKGYATEFSAYNPVLARKTLDIVLGSIVKSVAKNVKGKIIRVPSNISYALPATEKQFTGMFPSGSSVKIPKDMVFGVHWENQNGKRIDLDLALVHVAGKLGWDGSYRSNGVLFSGDVTSAPLPKGASELFYIKRQAEGSFLLTLNYFNYDEGTPVPAKLLVAKQAFVNMGENFMVDLNNIVASTTVTVDKKQKVLGLIVTTTRESRFYFAETNIGRSISSSSSPYANHTRRYLSHLYQNIITLSEVLEEAGAKLVDQDEEKFDVDLLPNALEKDTIINLLA